MRVVCCFIAVAALAAAADERALRKFVYSATPTLPRFVEGCSENEITSGSVIENSLTLTDCSLRLFNPSARVGLRADAYRLAVDRNLVVQVKAQSEEFEPDILVLGSDGSLVASDNTNEIDRQAVAFVHLPPGTYTLLATSLNGMGAYKLSVQADPPRSCAGRDATIGEETSGSFTSSDCRLVDLAPYETETIGLDFYSVTVSERQVLTLSYSSAAVAGLLALFDETGRVIVSSDGVGLEANAMASVAPGKYLVYVASADGSIGDYKLKLATEEIRTCSSLVLNAGESVNGELTGADCRDLDIFVPGSDQSPTDAWSLNVKDRALVTLTMRSTDFDSFLGLAMKNNKVIAFNDDFEKSTADSQVQLSLDAGEYRALASRYEGSGAYALSFNAEPLRSCDMPDLGTGPTTGTLASEDCRLLDHLTHSSDAALADAFRLRVSTKTVYSFDLSSAAFLPAVRIYDRNMVLLYSTVATSAAPNAQFSILLAVGEYTVIVSTRDKIGDYTLSTVRQEPRVCESSGILSVDSTVNGTLSSTDCAIVDAIPGLVADTKVDLYTFNSAESQTLKFTADSDSFPSMILIYDDKDNLITYTLNESFRTHAEVTATLPPGNYTVALTTLLRLQGPYTLTANSVPAP
jgi:hypothetical protein